MTPSASAIRIQRRSTTVWVLFRRYLSESTIGKHNQPYIMIPSNNPMSINRKAGTSIDSIPYRYNNYLADFFKSNCSSLRVNICKISAEGQYNMSGVYLIQLAVVIQSCITEIAVPFNLCHLGRNSRQFICSRVDKCVKTVELTSQQHCVVCRTAR